MRTQTQTGNVITVAAPYAVASGDGAKVGSFFGIATSAAAISASLELALTGTYAITCLAADSGAVGTKMYWDDTNKRLTTTASTHMFVGSLTVSKVASETTATIRLNGIAV